MHGIIPIILFLNWLQLQILKLLQGCKDLIIYDIPQGTVNNNLGPDRLEGPQALDPNHYRQLTL